MPVVVTKEAVAGPMRRDLHRVGEAPAVGEPDRPDETGVEGRGSASAAEQTQRDEDPHASSRAGNVTHGVASRFRDRYPAMRASMVRTAASVA
jgi:hypothetical protein